MDKSLENLCDALKRIGSQLKPQNNSISFILVTGKRKQGKSAFLKQSSLKQYTVDPENNANFFYNDLGIILELGEAWLNQSENLLTFSLKKLNRCVKGIKISGIILCVDSSELFLAEPLTFQEQCKKHSLLLENFANALDYPIDTALMLTKLDTLAGFAEFFQSEHEVDLKKPLGFSLDLRKERTKLISQYHYRFDQMVEVLGQQLINKLHPARSSLKRTLIREFPLQLAGLRAPIQTILQNINHNLIHLQAIYFSSAEQGGLSVDRLNKKIQHEYALSVQDRFPQSTNYRAYFIEGAIHSFQIQSQYHLPQLSRKQHITIATTATVVSLLLAGLSYQYFKTSRLLDEASKELIAYETLTSQANKTAALYHLSLAENKLNLIPKGILQVSIINQLKTRLHKNTKIKLRHDFLADLIASLEETLTNPSQTQSARYQALKVYLMIGESEHFSEAEIHQWFNQYWQTTHATKLNNTQEILLKKALKQPFQPLPINLQLVTDARNYLNALPATYLYYSLAKSYFPKENLAINLKGFNLSNKEIPIYFTKEGFKKVTTSLPNIAQKLQQENWVLARQDLSTLSTQLEQAYHFDYITWWQNFIKRVQFEHYQNYEQARQLIQILQQTNAITRLLTFMQQQTSPESGEQFALFNQKIASQFTPLNLISMSATQEFTQNIRELEKLLTTLSLIKDNGQTVFNLTRSRFLGESVGDPLSMLYSRAKQLPEPVASWAKQLADDVWFIFINDSKQYLNKKWQDTVFTPYQQTIAHRYPLDSIQEEDVSLADFNNFFAPQGILNTFVSNYLKPFLDISHPEWRPKELNGFVLPISADLVNELIRANVISNMFFPDNNATSKIEFSLQKINLDPVVANLELSIGQTTLQDTQTSESYISFNWPQTGAKLILSAIDGSHFELEEKGVWAFFKMLQKVNVLVDNNDSANLQILFEVNGNSGRYLLKTQNQINPFSPGILSGFSLKKEIA
ncbi:type IVB secretion system protein IcmF [Legionella gresilensis]|uniref:type IVB secretion system protein IcmF n=1 Tax=Legionella gresilensis TaxID=91823 RepID=UPI0010414511|nr:type IVB secretion system protein IcmF [Legionella gresilensis]